MSCQTNRASSQGGDSSDLNSRPVAVKALAAPAPLPSTAVLRGQKSVSIEHEGVIYRLQVTKLGKLILTK
ncbi:hemin uptake protein HemP [Rhodoferax sp. 4810]|nr:hemin uptake protein HemP [Rhodoferax jenense]